MPPHPPRSPRTPRRTANPYARPRTPRTPRTPNTAARGLSLTCPRSPKRKRPVALSPSPRRGVIDFAASTSAGAATASARARRKSTGDLTPKLKKQRIASHAGAGGEGAGREASEAPLEDIEPEAEAEAESMGGPSTPRMRSALPPFAPSEPGSEAGTPRRDTPARASPRPASTRVLRSSRALALLATLEEQVAGLKRQLLGSEAENARLTAELAAQRAQLGASTARTEVLEGEATRLRMDHDVLARRVLALEAGYVCKCQGEVQGMKLDLARILASSAQERWRRRADAQPDDGAAEE